MERYAMVVDYKYCTACHSCEVSCMKEKELPKGEWGIKLTEHGPAMIQGKWMWNYVPVPSDACDFCESRLGKGEKPLCEIHCLAGCISIVPIDEVGAKLVELGEDVAVFA